MSLKLPLAISAAALAAAAAALIPTTGAQSTDAQAQSSGPGTVTVHMRHREAKVSLVDLPPKRTRRRSSESPGDLAVSSARLRNAAGAVIGELHSSFMITGGRGEATTEQVNATFVLRDGQIAVQGMADNRKRDEPMVVAITGGTGRYEGARGSMHVRESRSAVTFELRMGG